MRGDRGHDASVRQNDSAPPQARHKEKSMHAAAAQPALNDIVALSAQALSDAIRQRNVSCREVAAAI